MAVKENLIVTIDFYYKNNVFQISHGTKKHLLKQVVTITYYGSFLQLLF